MSERVPSALRSAVQQRARLRCEYCLLHEADAVLSHQPDHIVAYKHGGRTELDNLAWTCFLCNRWKGSDIASIDVETGRVVRLFHPRQDRWTDHFRLEGVRIVPLTPEGRATEYLLKLNHPDNLKLRAMLIASGRYPE
jgi:hypothetical protein